MQGSSVCWALAIAHRPIGQPTAHGRLGSLFVHWGFRAGEGQLSPPILISWLVWLLLGGAVIALVRNRGEPQFLLLILAWAVDLAALFYAVGVMLANRSGSNPSSLLPVAGVLCLMLPFSAGLWFTSATAAARRLAVLIAGVLPLVIGVGYEGRVRRDRRSGRSDAASYCEFRLAGVSLGWLPSPQPTTLQ